MVRIAITGGIACGKSEVAAMVAAQGIPVCEADALAHAVLAPGEAVHAAVISHFGAGVTDSSGAVDRVRLGRVVFGDEQKLAELNRLTHPEIMRRLRAWVAEQGATHTLVAAVIPLLYEIGDEANWDRVICVASPESDQRRRLAARGLSEAEARLRVMRQWPQAVKMERADYVIYNSGTRELLQQQTNDVIKHIRGA